jgi:ubiquinone/menaquinone biosynthesis C-methylase UbiE
MDEVSFSYKDYYKKIAPIFDRVRLDRGEEISYTTSVICRVVSHSNGLLLDIGCGTGRYALHLKGLGYNVMGVDISPDQLSYVPKSIPTFCASATDLPFDNCSFSGCIIIMVLQLLSSKERKKAFFEAYRVLEGNSIFIIKTCSHDDLRKRPFNDVFPSSLPINLQRYPDIPLLKEDLEKVGFKILEVVPTYTEQEFKNSDLLYNIKNKHNTTLALLPKEGFITGYRALEKKLEKNKKIKIPHHHTIIISKKK